MYLQRATPYFSAPPARGHEREERETGGSRSTLGLEIKFSGEEAALT